uniref:Uncharacterized protein n=1 Tax=Leersia perrieri TaxID=77586 RepID=A0A0D9VNW3_9ORYZ
MQRFLLPLHSPSSARPLRDRPHRIPILLRRLVPAGQPCQCRRCTSHGHREAVDGVDYVGVRGCGDARRAVAAGDGDADAHVPQLVPARRLHRVRVQHAPRGATADYMRQARLDRRRNTTYERRRVAPVRCGWRIPDPGRRAARPRRRAQET